MTKSVILVGPLPPPFHGQSNSFAMLNKELSKSSTINVVDISDKRPGWLCNKWLNFTKSLIFILPFIKFTWLAASTKSRVYLTIAQSKEGFFRDVFFIWISALFSRPIVLHLKGGNYGNFYSEQSNILKLLIRATLKRAEKILVLSKRLDHIFDFEPQLRAKIFVVENGITFNPPKSIDSRKFGKKFKLLYLSNLIESKGYFDVLRAAKLLAEENISFHVDFAGEFMNNKDDTSNASVEEKKQNFLDYISANNLGQYVQYHGIVSGENTKHLLMSANAMVLATNYDNEGQPVSMIEALAYGVPIIGTNYRAIPDMLIDHKTGFFVSYNKPEDIVSAIKKLQNPAEYFLMSKHCRDLFEEKFTTEKHINRIIGHILGYG